MADDEIERLAVEELLKEAKRGAERAKDLGASGWAKPPIPQTNKRFLTNTILSTIPSQQRKKRIHSSSSDEDNYKSSRDHRKSRRSKKDDYGRRSHDKGHKRSRDRSRRKSKDSSESSPERSKDRDRTHKKHKSKKKKSHDDRHSKKHGSSGNKGEKERSGEKESNDHDKDLSQKENDENEDMSAKPVCDKETVVSELDQNESPSKNNIDVNVSVPILSCSEIDKSSVHSSSNGKKNISALDTCTSSGPRTEIQPSPATDTGKLELDESKIFPEKKIPDGEPKSVMVSDSLANENTSSTDSVEGHLKKTDVQITAGESGGKEVSCSRLIDLATIELPSEKSKPPSEQSECDEAVEDTKVKDAEQFKISTVSPLTEESKTSPTEHAEMGKLRMDVVKDSNCVGTNPIKDREDANEGKKVDMDSGVLASKKKITREESDVGNSHKESSENDLPRGKHDKDSNSHERPRDRDGHHERHRRDSSSSKISEKERDRKKMEQKETKGKSRHEGKRHSSRDKKHSEDSSIYERHYDHTSRKKSRRDNDQQFKSPERKEKDLSKDKKKKHGISQIMSEVKDVCNIAGNKNGSLLTEITVSLQEPPGVITKMGMTAANKTNRAESAECLGESSEEGKMNLLHEQAIQDFSLVNSEKIGDSEIKNVTISKIKTGLSDSQNEMEQLTDKNVSSKIELLGDISVNDNVAVVKSKSEKQLGAESADDIMKATSGTESGDSSQKETKSTKHKKKKKKHKHKKDSKKKKKTRSKHS